MRIQCGILACLLAGCAAQPSRSTSPDALSTPLATLPDTQTAVRIGLEFLPPDERFPDPAERARHVYSETRRFLDGV